jgi:hypothetical protein
MIAVMYVDLRHVRAHPVQDGYQVPRNLGVVGRLMVAAIDPLTDSPDRDDDHDDQENGPEEPASPAVLAVVRGRRLRLLAGLGALLRIAATLRLAGSSGTGGAPGLLLLVPAPISRLWPPRLRTACLISH